MRKDGQRMHSPDEYATEDYGEGRVETRERTNTNWWPLLLVPLAFFLGMGVDRNDNNRRVQNQQVEYGVGGAPDRCITPGMNTQ
jgi:hypothetical protein